MKPFHFFVVLCLVNLLNFVDRGVIPGAPSEFNSFIDSSLRTDTPDVYLGLLQSAFIVGMLAGLVLFGHLIHFYGRFYLTAVGCTIWVLAVFLCGLSRLTGSYEFLLFARVISGFGEASLQCTVPPWIQETAPPAQRGMWLASFYTAIPVGTALGYAISAVVADSLGWEWTFYLEGLLMLPFIWVVLLVAPSYPCSHYNSPPSAAVTASTDHGEQGATIDKDTDSASPPSMLQELCVVLRSPLLVTIMGAYAAQAAVLIGLSTFGTEFVLGLGYFDKESDASTVFGLLISFVGVVATPLGGACLDWANKGIVAADAEDGSDLDISSAAATFRGDSHGKECEYGIEQIPTSSDPLNTVDRTVSEPLLGDDAATISSKNYDRGVIRNLLIQLPLFLGVGCMLLCLLYVCTNKVLFFFVIAVGLGVVFMSNAGLNMGVLLAVPIENRSFAISVNTIFLHAFGDVPAPVIVGLMKDSFAPACSAGNSDDDNVLTSDECRDQSQRLRLCMLLTSLWLLWAQFFFFFGWYAHNTRMEVMPYEKWWSAITRFWRVATCNIFSNNDNRNSDRDRQTSQQSTKQFTGAGELSATYNPVWNGVDPHNPQDEVMANFASDVGSSSAMSGRSIVLKDNLENDAYENFHFGRSSGGSSPTNL